ncbi:MAG: nucleoside triphosphate pyrophosphohydrolase [Bacteroidetes bacterium]|nr:nucleoside triphosphate pyrophosphohydrolase [Bacteroidota bacterium]
MTFSYIWSVKSTPSSADLAMSRLLSIMDDLRENCPWDRKQTLSSLRQLTIEETYELADAITNQDLPAIKEELGDLLLHLVFYAKIASEQNAFTFNEVVEGICKKLIDRHPHIYGEVKVKDELEVKMNWEKLKMKEGKSSVLSGVPVSLPALVKAMRLQEKSKQVGFEWEHAGQVWDKVKEEMMELEQEVTIASAQELKRQERIEEEFGDLLFSLVNYARFLHVDPEIALELTNKKFVRRFQLMEAEAHQGDKALSEMTLEEMDAIWNKIKHLSSK